MSNLQDKENAVVRKGSSRVEVMGAITFQQTYLVHS